MGTLRVAGEEAGPDTMPAGAVDAMAAGAEAARREMAKGGRRRPQCRKPSAKDRTAYASQWEAFMEGWLGALKEALQAAREWEPEQGG